MTHLDLFISYSHDSNDHELQVRSLAHQLRTDGINAVIDQYQIVPAEGWPLWMEKQIRDAEFVLCICTETYLRRVMKEEMPGKGLGVLWEATIIYAHLYGAGVANEKFIPIVFNPDDIQYIPVPLQPTTYYQPKTDVGYEKLYRRLTNQPETPPPPLGSRRLLPSAAGAARQPSSVATVLAPNLVHPYPLQMNFTGRLKERQELTDWLADDGHAICVVTAIGGMGKSALTWYWLTVDILASNAGFKVHGLGGVMWWSFYEAESSFSTFIDTALEYITDRPIDSERFPTPYDRSQELRRELETKRILFVLDGFERQLRAYTNLEPTDDRWSLDSDARSAADPIAARWLTEVSGGQSRAKVLLTSRLMIRDLEDRSGDELAGVVQRRLIAMPDDDAIQFMRAQGVSKGTVAEIRRLCQSYGNHPLSLRLLSGLITRDLEAPGDVAAGFRHDVHGDLIQRQHHILTRAYDAMPKRERALLSRIAAFRGPITSEALLVFNTLGDEKRFQDAVQDLRVRGFLQYDLDTRRYDLHPIVRDYAYDRLTDKAGIHNRLKDYFAKIPVPHKSQVKNIEELAPLLELYHHLVRAGQYNEAFVLLLEKLIPDPLFYRFGEYQLMFELVSGLFPNGDGSLPQLKEKFKQAGALSMLGNAYMFMGQLQDAMRVFSSSMEIVENFEVPSQEKNLLRVQYNVAVVHLMLGELKMAEFTLRSSIKVSHKIGDTFWEAAERVELGRVLSYVGNFDEAESQFQLAKPVLNELGASRTNYVSVLPSYVALMSLLRGQTTTALISAKEALVLAQEVASKRHPYVRDFVEAEGCLGAALLREGRDLDEAATHLTEALKRCRKINLVESEPAILLSLANWHAMSGTPEEAKSYAEEALVIADRCGYRLRQAEIHNFLAYLARDSGNHLRAREHAEMAKERAWCDGPTHSYQTALDQAQGILNELDAEKVRIQ